MPWLLLFPPEHQPAASAYMAGQDDGGARGLWQAATTLRREGMALIGTELDPDFAWADGMYTPFHERARAEASGLLAMGDLERARVEASRTAPDLRFHYRYRAAALAREAAEHLPPDSEDAVAMLCQAGTWLRYLDPEAADPYYKDMVNRGWNTALGREAEALRWFPGECPVSGELPGGGCGRRWGLILPIGLLGGLRRRGSRGGVGGGPTLSHPRLHPVHAHRTGPALGRASLTRA